MTLFYIIGGIGLFLGIAAFFIVMNMRKKGSAVSQDLAPEEEERLSSISDTALPRRFPQDFDEDEAEDRTEIVSTIHMTRPSPERPINESDAALIDIIRQVPELPSAVMELSHLLRDPNVQIKKIVALINTDPVLSAKVLRVVNSAAVGRGRITSLQQAVVLLGINNIWIMVNQILSSKSIKPFTQIPDEAMKALWRHAAATATCSKHLLLKTGLYSSEIGPSVLTCALLHDVGKFLLWGLDSSPVDDQDPNIFSVIKEDAAYGLDHCRMAYLLTTHWKLPELLCSVIAYHHHPSFANWHEIPSHIKQAAILVSISDSMARIAGFYDDKPRAFMIPEEVMEKAGLNDRTVEKILSSHDLKADLAQMDALINAASDEVIL